MQNSLSNIEIYKKEKKKLLNLIDQLDKIESINLCNNNLYYLIIKLQELNLDLKTTIDDINNDDKKIYKSQYINSEFNRRDKISDLLPIFTYIYMNYNNI